MSNRRSPYMSNRRSPRPSKWMSDAGTSLNWDSPPARGEAQEIPMGEFKAKTEQNGPLLPFYACGQPENVNH